MAIRSVEDIDLHLFVDASNEWTDRRRAALQQVRNPIENSGATTRAQIDAAAQRGREQYTERKLRDVLGEVPRRTRNIVAVALAGAVLTTGVGVAYVQSDEHRFPEGKDQIDRLGRTVKDPSGRFVEGGDYYAEYFKPYLSEGGSKAMISAGVRAHSNFPADTQAVEVSARLQRISELVEKAQLSNDDKSALAENVKALTETGQMSKEFDALNGKDAAEVVATLKGLPEAQKNLSEALAGRAPHVTQVTLTNGKAVNNGFGRN